MEEPNYNYTDMVGHYRKRVYAYCFLMSRSNAEAYDLSQEVFYEAWRQFHCCKAVTARQQWVWLRSVMRTTVAQHWRRANKSVETTNLALAADKAAPEVDADRELLLELAAYLDDENDRRLLHDMLDGWTRSEIAHRLGISVATLNQRVHRMIKRLQTIKEQLYG